MKIVIWIFAALIIFLPSFGRAQEKEVIEQLKNIEKGNAAEAQSTLPALKKKYGANPSIIFLEAVLTADGDAALEMYKTVYEKHPKNPFADASLYRIFSYYYSMGLYKKAEETLNKLKKEYPSSPYVQTADRTIPEELPEENPIARVPVKMPVEKQEEYKFTVQAGAFLNIQNAQTLKKNLESDGYPSEIIPKDVGGTILNVVMAGKFAAEKNADSLISHLDKKYRIKGRVVPIIK